uniref:Cytosol aminopeptidase domain-containing protein n=1 Tax=Plectus sambesii TaxID=2011161 RepID=A0A914WL62_9BILA
MAERFLPCPLVPATSIEDTSFDGVIIVTHCAKALTTTKQLQPIAEPISAYLQLNEGVKSAGNASVVAVPNSIVPSGRVVLSCTGPVTRDYDDVRRFSDAAKCAIKTAIKAGIKSPLLVTIPHEKYANAELVSILGALHALFVPLNVREEDNKPKAAKLGVLALGTDGKKLIELASGLEAGSCVARDIGDSDPERMAPPRVADYVVEAFKGGNVKVEVEADQAVIKKEYPLMAAVNRAANCVPEHQARLIWLEYIPEGPIEETLMLVGKGVTIDTGGIDLKVGGSMFGMSRDKYGSAGVAGIFKVLDILRPKGLKVVGYMCMVRNSIGSHGYTCDEIIKSRSGKRIRIYNTDAEGRITMLDPLTRMREMAKNEVNPHLMTMATLTGHAAIAMGMYPAVMDNGPALKSRCCYTLQEAAHEYGQPVEISRYRHEDFDFHRGESEAEDLRQGNTKPSVQTLRGHQCPAAFMLMGSRLDEHGTDSAHPIKFTHIDLGGSEGPFPGTSNAAPLVALSAKYIVPRVV